MGEVRNAARSREAILDAAERLFAECGYERTTLEQIGRAARLSRGTPRYFFGSKEQLYRAVLTRFFQFLEQLARDIEADAAAGGGNLESLVTVAVRRRLAFLAARPSFTRLQEWEALAGRELQAMFPPQVRGLEIAVDAVARAMPGNDRTAAALAVLSVIALTSYPFAHPELVRALGLDPESPRFLEALAVHVTELLTHGLGAAAAHPAEEILR